jgi:hypothetical protein
MLRTGASVVRRLRICNRQCRCEGNSLWQRGLCAGLRFLAGWKTFLAVPCSAAVGPATQPPRLLSIPLHQRASRVVGALQLVGAQGEDGA